MIDVRGPLSQTSARAPADGEVVWSTVIDGAEIEVRRNHAGVHSFRSGQDAHFRLTTSGRQLVCDVRDPTGFEWQRVLLDTVLFSAALIMGEEAIHAGAVERDGGVVAIVSSSGGGKTSVAAEFLLRGCSLFTDDVLVLRDSGDSIAAQPGPPLMNLPDNLMPRLAGFATSLARVHSTDEHWVLVPSAARPPAPLEAICLLERGAWRDQSITLVEPSPLTLLSQAVFYRHLTDRAEQRFSLHAAVARHVPVYRVRANLKASSSTIADLVETGLHHTAT